MGSALVVRTTARRPSKSQRIGGPRANTESLGGIFGRMCLIFIPNRNRPPKANQINKIFISAAPRLGGAPGVSTFFEGPRSGLFQPTDPRIKIACVAERRLMH